ncbi:MAG: hypothetical protein KDC31_08000 [Saprospiraceae bacterium]|nr:hypothetical protein [Candidatus Parvibacillus calidus]MCB0591218.1 hypothetical protein [Saprospiraceae bacterium]MCO5282867.1 hypothetical protein [Saprospiraceae bacterium]QLH29802.1 MAG: hypothetical protein HWD63_10655 [Candidatus Parvibacillus calidus]HMZ25255.1 hypothetical protein [Saprospiraceae bacterium]
MLTKLTFIPLIIMLILSMNSGLAMIHSPDSTGPKVFLLGDDENLMNSLSKNYPTLLMKVCKDDMEVAYNVWMEMLSDMEAYATKINFDIRGTKLWMNVYWNKNGKIEYIGYYLKPNSRNVKTEEMNAFFASFMKNYQMNLSYTGRFYHNGSAAFPTHFKALKDKEGG